METETPYYIQRLKEDFSQKQRRFPRYSLRAYARDLGMHAATLSMIFKGRRGLPLTHSKRIVERLSLGPKEQTLFLDSLNQGRTNLDQIKINYSDERLMLDDSYFNIIAEWEHYAVLTLFDCDDFTPSITAISARLGITQNRAEVVLNNLLTCGLLIEEEGNLKKVYKKVRTTEDITSAALKKGHIETLEMGIDKLEKIDVPQRDFSSIMIAIDPDKIPDAKVIIREFRQKMARLLEEGQRSEVYQLAIQFYPMTQIIREENP